MGDNSRNGPESIRRQSRGVSGEVGWVSPEGERALRLYLDDRHPADVAAWVAGEMERVPAMGTRQLQQLGQVLGVRFLTRQAPETEGPERPTPAVR